MALEDRIRLPALNLIHRRRRLLNLLDDFIQDGKRLITIYAPGGYGKSILLADFAQTTNLPVCWCSLEPVDRDPTSFLTLLAYSITDRFHEIEPDSLLRLVAQGDTPTSVRRIADELAAVGPHIVIIDDYHKAVSASVTLALNKLLEQLPSSSAMIVAARGDMTLETGQIIELLIADRVAGLSEEELRFTAAELQMVMRKRFGRRIELDEAEQIAQATDGNIAQILMAGHIMHTERIINRLSQRLGDDRDIIYHYLAEEVFAKQSPNLQHFLLCTSVLPEMTIGLCNDLLETTSARTYLEALIHNDLFIAQIGTGFRYHDLFADFLRAKLAEDTTLYHQVSVRAADLLAVRERFEDAIDRYLAAQAWSQAANLLEEKGRFFYDTGRALTLNGWLAQLPESVLARRPRLLLLRGVILNDDLGEPDRAMQFYRRAEAQFLAQNDMIGAAEAQVLRSAQLRMTGQAESLTLASTALAQLEALQADDYVLAWAIRHRGLAHWAAGNLTESLADLRLAMGRFDALDDRFNVGRCHHEIGVVLVAQGNLSAADFHYRQAIRIWETLGNASYLANTLNSLGVSLYVTGQFDEAFKQFNQSLSIALQIGATRRAAFAQAGLSDTYLARREFSQAITAYQLSREFAREAGVQSLEVYDLVKLGDCYFEQGNLAQALIRASQARELATELGLVYEKGLACTLQGKIYLRQGEYGLSSDFFEKALIYLADADVLEEAKVRLWWGYGLLLDLRSSAAFEKLQETIALALNMGQLLQGLRQTIADTKSLLLHFYHATETPAGLRDSIGLLLVQSPTPIARSGPALQVFSFGVPVLIVAGERRQFSQRGRTRKLPEFLLYLILEGQHNGCRWSDVSAAIWPELDSDKASVNFHQSLKRLREAVFQSPDYVTLLDDYYLINRDYLTWCDALAFEALYERAASLSPEQALPLQLEIISLYRGEFLAGFDVEEWASTYRARCMTRFFQVVKLASEQLLRIGNPGEALGVINKGLAQDYYREELHQVAFKAYTQLELYDQLAAHYQQLCTVFAQELGGQPQPETQRLYKQLLVNRKTTVNN